MKLSTRGRYGARVLLDLALQEEGKPVPLKEIAKRQQISALYIEQLITPLIAAGMIRSTRGAGGGIWLVKPASEIKLSEIIELLEGPISPVHCVDNPNACSRSDLCVTRDVWIELKKSVSMVLESKTLQDLVEMQKRKKVPAKGLV
ncbi:MAG: Rrf2 family transcriptional regulator [Coprothermobacterota bacterium]|nr:Rrf2 family transcriptional regulator [Coprothermobacterota bacterium]